jgi:hypothetical protein
LLAISPNNLNSYLCLRWLMRIERPRLAFLSFFLVRPASQPSMCAGVPFVALLFLSNTPNQPFTPFAAQMYPARSV